MLAYSVFDTFVNEINLVSISFFNDSVGKYDCAVLNGWLRMNNGLEKMWMKALMV
jgi:hypothetical protein